jgi:hypothetical protein
MEVRVCGCFVRHASAWRARSSRRTASTCGCHGSDQCSRHDRRAHATLTAARASMRARSRRSSTNTRTTSCCSAHCRSRYAGDAISHGLRCHSRGIPARADNDVAWDSTVRLPRCRDAWALGHDRPQLCRRTAQRPGRSSIRTHAPKTLVAAAAKGSAIDWRRIRCRGKGAYPKGRRARGLVRTPT